jgi:hypothetical protein
VQFEVAEVVKTFGVIAFFLKNETLDEFRYDKIVQSLYAGNHRMVPLRVRKTWGVGKRFSRYFGTVSSNGSGSCMLG